MGEKEPSARHQNVQRLRSWKELDLVRTMA